MSLHKGRLPWGVRTAQISFETSSAVRPDGVISIRATAVRAFAVVPPSAALMGTQPKCVRALNADGAPARISRISSSHPWIVATLLEGGTALQLVNSSGHEFVERAEVRIEDEFGHTIEIPIVASQ